MADTQLLTAEQLAERLSVSPSTIKTWSRSGLIPQVRISPKIIRFDPDAVIDALRRRNVDTSTIPSEPQNISKEDK